MPIVKEKNILLVHIPKTAGISVAHSLGLNFSEHYNAFRALRPPRVYKPTSEGLISKMLKFRSSSHNDYYACHNNDVLIGGVNLFNPKQNLTLSEILGYGFLSLREFRKMSLLVTIRNPYDRFLSLYSYWRFPEGGYSIDYVIENCLYNAASSCFSRTILKTFSPMLSYVQCPYCDIGEFDFIRTELFRDDLLRFGKKFDLKLNEVPGKINVSESSNFSLNERQRKLVGEYYSSDFEYFGYKS